MGEVHLSCEVLFRPCQRRAQFSARPCGYHRPCGDSCLDVLVRQAREKVSGAQYGERELDIQRVDSGINTLCAGRSGRKVCVRGESAQKSKAGQGKVKNERQEILWADWMLRLQSSPRPPAA